MEHTMFLAICKKLGLYRKPIYAVAQIAYVVDHPNPIKRLKQYLQRYFYFRGVDSIIFLNEPIYHKSKKYPVRPKLEKFSDAWGAEIAFFQDYAKQQEQAPLNNYIFSTGGTTRDFDTLVNAFDGMDFGLTIVPKKGDLSDYIKVPIPDNVTIDTSMPIGLESTGKLRKHYYNALAVALPLSKVSRFAPYGSAVMVEAMAMGKPILSTYNPAHPVDIEKEKIGITVDYGDVEGWKQAIQYLIDHPDETKEMGERALHVCKNKLNYQRFSAEIVGGIRELLALKEAKARPNPA